MHLVEDDGFRLITAFANFPILVASLNKMHSSVCMHPSAEIVPRIASAAVQTSRLLPKIAAVTRVQVEVRVAERHGAKLGDGGAVLHEEVVHA